MGEQSKPRIIGSTPTLPSDIQQTLEHHKLVFEGDRVDTLSKVITHVYRGVLQTGYGIRVHLKPYTGYRSKEGQWFATIYTEGSDRIYYSKIAGTTDGNQLMHDIYRFK